MTPLRLRLVRLGNAVVLAIVYFLTVWPTAVVLRCLGKRPLQLDWEPDRESYWISRKSLPQHDSSMKRQF